jgi:hypothetical protein
MKTFLSLCPIRTLQWALIVAGITVAIYAETWVASRFSCGGSTITNPSAFATEQVAMDLHLATH